MTNINICSLHTLSKSKESAKYLWFLLRCKLSNCTELQFHIHALMILRKIRLLLSNNPFIHFPVWHFDSSYNINFVSLEDQTMQIIITTISCVPLALFLFYAPLVISKSTDFKCVIQISSNSIIIVHFYCDAVSALTSYF